MSEMACPVCGEPAIHRPLATLMPYEAHGMRVPEWSHADGEPLCPVIGPGGYQPARPVPARRNDAEDAGGQDSEGGRR